MILIYIIIFYNWTHLSENFVKEIFPMKLLNIFVHT